MREFTALGEQFLLTESEIYVDHEAVHRSGHMGHAIQRLSSGRIIDFNANTSPYRLYGHAAYGWMEYRYSSDEGMTWTEPTKFPYSWQALMDGMFTVSVEKAVATNDGGLVAFCLRNSPYREICCEPWYTPMYVKSMDEGQTWSEAKELTPYAGRVYDARYYEGNIYVLEFCNDASGSFVGSLPEHQYRIYISKDQGETFEELCVVPFPSTLSRGYGSMIFREDGSLIVYAYNKDDEEHMDYIISYDLGKTWTENGTCYLAKKIRNPQTALLDGIYILLRYDYNNII